MKARPTFTPPGKRAAIPAMREPARRRLNSCAGRRALYFHSIALAVGILAVRSGRSYSAS